jgi:hypothetical protein
MKRRGKERTCSVIDSLRVSKGVDQISMKLFSCPCGVQFGR